MRVHIHTEYLGQISYRLAVLVDGCLAYTLPATSATVVRVRNREISRWTRDADEVTADAIPDAADVAPKRLQSSDSRVTMEPERTDRQTDAYPV